MSRTWLVVLCIVLIICFAVAYADLHHKWQDEKSAKSLFEAAYKHYYQQAEYYQELYSDCLNQENLGNITYWWEQ